MLSEINLAGQGASFFGTRFLGRGLREKLEIVLDEDEGGPPKRNTPSPKARPVDEVQIGRASCRERVLNLV